ncbi:hypothetical protein ACETU7_03385 [Rhodococcus sp. 3Y1]
MNTTKQIGGALGLSVLVTYAATNSLDKDDLWPRTTVRSTPLRQS